MEQEQAREDHDPITALRLYVDRWAAVSPDLDSREAWIAWAHGHDLPPNPGSSLAPLPTILRRRVTPVGQLIFRAAQQLVIPANTRFIFASRHGEFQRSLKILEALAANEPVSPAEFSLSVNNALAGLLSIAWRNRAGHTTIAAGTDSFRSGLIEAAACLIERPDEPVLLAYFEDRLTAPYDEIADSDETALGLALLLSSTTDGADNIMIGLNSTPAIHRESASDQALAFLRFLLTEADADPTRRWWRCG